MLFSGSGFFRTERLAMRHVLAQQMLRVCSEGEKAAEKTGRSANLKARRGDPALAHLVPTPVQVAAVLRTHLNNKLKESGLTTDQLRAVFALLVEIRAQLPHVKSATAKRRRDCIKARLLHDGLAKLGLLAPAVRN